MSTKLYSFFRVYWMISACSDLAFDGCIHCENADSNGVSLCLECEYGRTLKDDLSECLCKLKIENGLLHVVCNTKTLVNSFSSIRIISEKKNAKLK